LASTIIEGESGVKSFNEFCLTVLSGFYRQLESDTGLRICLRSQLFLPPCQHNSTVNRLTLFLIKMRMISI